MKPMFLLTHLMALLTLTSLLPAMGETGRFHPVNLSPLSCTQNNRCKRSFPGAGQHTFVALGFSPARQEILEKGLRQALSLETRSPHKLKAFEIAVIPSSYSPVKTAVHTYMKNRVKDKTLYQRIYPWYTDSSALKKSLNLPSASEYAFLLLDPKGDVVWKTLKPLTEADLVVSNRILSPLTEGK